MCVVMTLLGVTYLHIKLYKIIRSQIKQKDLKTNSTPSPEYEDIEVNFNDTDTTAVQLKVNQAYEKP